MPFGCYELIVEITLTLHCHPPEMNTEGTAASWSPIPSTCSGMLYLCLLDGIQFRILFQTQLHKAEVDKTYVTYR